MGKTFLLQLEPNGHYAEDTATIARLIDEHNWLYQNNEDKYEIVEELKMDLLDCNRIEIENIIPVGSVEFVNSVLNRFGLAQMKPINIPVELQKMEFLKRETCICDEKMMIEMQGLANVLNYLGTMWNTDKFFIKSNTQVKTDYTGIYKATDEIFRDKEYFISRPVEFISEYRCFVYRNQLRGIKNYLGNPWVLPYKSFVEKCIAAMPKDLIAYTLDIGVMKNGENAVIEVHNFLACGLYGFDDMCILNMLANAWKYELKKGTCTMKL